MSASPARCSQLSAEEFARRANEKLGDKAKVVVFGSSQLGTDEELLQKLRLGTADIALPSTVMSSVVPEFGLFEMPYLVKDREHMKRIEEEIVWPMLAPAAEAQGLQGSGGLGERLPPHHQQRAADRQARGPEGHQAQDAERRMARQDVPGLWRQSDADVVLGGVHRAADRRHRRPGEPADPDLQRQVPGGAGVPVDDRPRLHAGLCARRQATAGTACRRTCGTILEETAKETQAFVYENAARLETELLQKIKAESDIEVNEADKDAFIAASEPIYEEFGKQVEGGKEMIDKAISLGQAVHELQRVTPRIGDAQAPPVTGRSAAGAHTVGMAAASSSRRDAALRG